MDTKRFHSPQYKRQIHANRTHKRVSSPRPETKLQRVLYSVGLGSRKSKVWTLLVLALLAYLTYFAKFLFLESPVVSGADQTQSVEIAKHLAAYTQTYMYALPQKNILFFNESSFTKYLLERDLQISSIVDIKRRPFNKLHIEVVQRVPVYAFLNKGIHYILNSDGNISYMASEQEAQAYPLIVNTANEDVVEGEKILSEEKKSFLSYMNANFEKEMSTAIEKFEMPGKASEQVTIVSKKGYMAYFDSQKDPETYLERLFAVWVALTTEQQSRLYYVDLRFEKGAYGCYRNDPCAN